MVTGANRARLVLNGVDESRYRVSGFLVHLERGLGGEIPIERTCALEASRDEFGAQYVVAHSPNCLGEFRGISHGSV